MLKRKLNIQPESWHEKQSTSQKLEKLQPSAGHRGQRLAGQSPAGLCQRLKPGIALSAATQAPVSRSQSVSGNA